jgi:hypothetical protein
MSMTTIGGEFGGRDHSTIVYALQQVEKSMEHDAKTKATVEDIIKNIRDRRKFFNIPQKRCITRFLPVLLLWSFPPFSSLIFNIPHRVFNRQFKTVLFCFFVHSFKTRIKQTKYTQKQLVLSLFKGF